MTRIFSVLSLLSVGLLIANFVVGFGGGDYNGLTQQWWQRHERLNQLHPDQPQDKLEIDQLRGEMSALQEELVPIQRRASFHMLLGVLAALVTVLVNSISVTYFIGTSRWCKEVTDAYQLGPDLAAKSRRIKRSSFPWALTGVMAVLAIVTCGAAADPGTLRLGTGPWVLPHTIVAVMGTVVIGWSLHAQTSKIAANYEVINEILGHVHEIRRAHGLDVETSADERAGQGTAKPDDEVHAGG